MELRGLRMRDGESNYMLSEGFSLWLKCCIVFYTTWQSGRQLSLALLSMSALKWFQENKLRRSKSGLQRHGEEPYNCHTT